MKNYIKYFCFILNVKHCSVLFYSELSPKSVIFYFKILQITDLEAKITDLDIKMLSDPEKICYVGKKRTG